MTILIGVIIGVIIAIIFFMLGCHQAYITIAEECERLGGFFVNNKTFSYKLERTIEK